MIKGIHHVSLRCHNEENYKETLKFYEDIIGMKVMCSWGEGIYAATMLELNGDVMEIFATGAASAMTGSVNHFAFLTDDVDEATLKVRNAGYPIVSAPADVNMPLNEPEGAVYPMRFSYCIGPVGEMIEFFCEREV